MRPMSACAFAIALLPALLAQDPPRPTFGTTVVIPSGLKGSIYYIPHNTSRLPDFERLKKPVGTIYTSELNVPTQNFKQGFPGVTDRFEWFAIDYTGKFWIEKPGLYSFVLTSDDGARLYIDDQLIADGDGTHQAEDRSCSIRLARGIHRMRVPYFQGPRFQVALVLKVAGPDEELRIFSTEEFKPPSNPETWPEAAKSEVEPPQ